MTQQKTQEKQNVLLLGATGLVGSELLGLLLDAENTASVTVAARRAAPEEWTARAGFTQKVQWRVVDFEQLQEQLRPQSHTASPSAPFDVVYCALGTTRARTPSQELYKRIEHTYPLACAQLAKNVVWVSSVGADATSSSGYLKMKGETERDLAELTRRDPERSLHVFQPSFLLGDRSEQRPAERFALSLLTPLAGAFAGPLARYRPIAARDVARAMHACTASHAGQAAPRGVHIHTYREIARLAQTEPKS